jgi:hypothetical protein
MPNACSATAFLLPSERDKCNVLRLGIITIDAFETSTTRAINCKFVALSKNVLSILKRLRITILGIRLF